MNEDVSYGPALAYAREVGDDAEFRVVSGIDALDYADDETAFYDAVFTDDVTSDDLPDWVRLDGVLTVDDGTRVEIKACSRTQSNGERPTAGRWTFKGRENGQHGKLVASDAVYLLTVYDAVDGDRELVAGVVVAARDLDRVLADRWYDVTRAENTMAQVAWKHLIELESGGST